MLPLQGNGKPAFDVAQDQTPAKTFTRFANAGQWFESNQIMNLIGSPDLSAELVFKHIDEERKNQTDQQCGDPRNDGKFLPAPFSFGRLQGSRFQPCHARRMEFHQ